MIYLFKIKNIIQYQKSAVESEELASQADELNIKNSRDIALYITEAVSFIIR